MYITQDEVRKSHRNGAVWCLVFGNHADGKPFSPSELYDEIRNAGIDIDENTVEELLGRWVNDGTITRTMSSISVIDGAFPVGMNDAGDKVA